MVGERVGERAIEWADLKVDGTVAVLVGMKELLKAEISAALTVETWA